MTTQVLKADGTKETYNEDKIRNSASRVGVPHELQEEMLASIRDRLYDGIKTSEIFAMIKEFLTHAGSPYLALKYNLKDALSELGPSGYPFEKYVALILAELGYTAEINQIIPGRCVTHEVDILAKKEDTTYFVEAKFHKNHGQRTDVRVTLYIKARYDDLSRAWTGGKSGAWIITNTRFSTDAIKYAECQGLKLTSWGYPKGEGIMDLIEQTKLHPITMIDSLTGGEKLRLMNEGVVTCKQLLEPQHQHLLPKNLINEILPQIQKICQSEH